MLISQNEGRPRSDVPQADIAHTETLGAVSFGLFSSLSDLLHLRDHLHFYAGTTRAVVFVEITSIVEQIRPASNGRTCATLRIPPAVFDGRGSDRKRGRIFFSFYELRVHHDRGDLINQTISHNLMPDQKNRGRRSISLLRRYAPRV